MHALLPVAALLLSVAILFTGNGLQGILLPVRASLESFSTFETGAIASCYFTGFAVGCLYGAKLIKRVGHIRTFAAMTALASTAALAHAIWVSPLPWWALRATSGFCFAVLYIVIESWLNERSTRATRGTILSAYMVINHMLLTLGQMLLPLNDPVEFYSFAITAMLISLAALPVALTAAMSPAPLTSTKLNMRHLLHVSPVGALGCVVVGLTNSAFWALAAVFAQQKQLDDGGIALFMSASVIGGAIGQWPLGRLSDKFDRRKVMLLSASLCVATSALLVLQRVDSTLVLMACGAMWGATAFPLYSLAVAHANDFAAPGEFVEVSSGLMLAFATGSVAGPMFASVAIEVLGIDGLYIYTASVQCIFIVFVIVRMRMRAAVPDAQQVKFAEALVAAQTISSVFDAETQENLQP